MCQYTFRVQVWVEKRQPGERDLLLQECHNSIICRNPRVFVPLGWRSVRLELRER